MDTTVDKEEYKCIVTTSGVWSATVVHLITMQLLQYAHNLVIMTIILITLPHSKYHYYLLFSINFNLYFYSTGTAWLNDVDCWFDENCLSQCFGGSCPSSSVSCNNAVNITCSRSSIY